LAHLLTRRIDACERSGQSLDSLNVISKISFAGTLHLRTPEEKRGYKGPLFCAFPDDLIISKIRVAQGSLCIVPHHLDRLAVSPEYPVYVPDRLRVRTDFLGLIIGSRPFRSRVSALRSGNTSKARIKPSDFEALSIPLPSLAEQDALVSAQSDAMARAVVLEQEAACMEQVGLRRFESALGLVESAPLPELPVLVARFRDMERWSHDSALRASHLAPAKELSCPVVALGDAVLDVRHGCSLGPSKSATGLRVLKISAVTKGVLDLTEVKHLQDSVAVREAYALQAGDVLLCRTNGTLAYVGMSVLVAADLVDTIFPDKVIRVKPDRSIIDPAFLWRVLQTRGVRSQIEARARTAVGNFAIGGRDIRSLEIPIPAIPEQRKLVRSLLDAMDSAVAKRAEATGLRRSAQAAFEAGLFWGSPGNDADV
jgi:type I restriction enzyme, S subunit